MKRWVRFVAALSLALTLGAAFGKLLTVYDRPMENVSYDLSLGWTTEAIPEGWVYDQKGWTVFTQEGETVTELTADGYGGFSGLSEPGQTFYFSRVIEEELNSPTLRLAAAEQTFSIFLDGVLIYSDCPELDNRIGSLRLPCLEWYREEPVLAALPPDCTGKVLTIAQSTAPAFDGGYARVYPCAVTLYCGYAYESALISESFQTAIPAALAYAAGLVLLALFLWQAFSGRLDPGTLCGALTAFLYLSVCITQPDFHALYFEVVPVDTVTLGRYLTLLTLLALLACKLSGRRRAVLGGAAAVLAVLALADTVLIALGNTGRALPDALGHLSLLPRDGFALLGSAALLLAPVLGLWEWNRRRWFFRCFCPLALAGIALYALPAALAEDPSIRSAAMLLWLLTGASIPAAFLSAAAEWVHDEIARRTEERLLLQRGELAQRSYEALRQQHEQVMVLRHDMVKHLRLLRQTTGDEKTAAYLDELIGENEEIRPVVQSGNEMVDVILNSKLSAAAGAGIAVELTRTQAPEALPLSDTELSALMLNLLDNALEAAAAPGVARRYLKLDLHVRGNFFVFICENGAAPGWINRKTAPERGLGLKAVRRIMERHGNLYKAEYGDGYYKATVLLPLPDHAPENPPAGPL